MAYGSMTIQRMPAAQVPQQYQQPPVVQQAGMQRPMARPQTFGQQQGAGSPYWQRAGQTMGRTIGPGQMGAPRAPQAPAGQPQQQGQWWDFQGRDPWSSGNFGPGQTQQEGLLNYLLKQAGSQGAFSGDYSQLLDPFKAAYQSDYGSGVRRAQLAGASGSMDPSQVAMLSRLGQSNAAGDSSRAMSQALLQLLQGRQNLNEGLLNSAIGFGQNWSQANQNALLQRIGQGEAQRNQQGGIGGVLGQAAGMGLGHLTGGLLR